MDGLITINLLEKKDTVRVSFKRTRRGKIRKIVRPVFFREDIACGIIGCSSCAEKDIFTQPSTLDLAKPILVIDAETAVHQSDFLLQDTCVSNCILSYTVLDAVKNVNRARADKLRSVCGAVEGIESVRSFYAFPNEFLHETFVPFPAVESTSSASRDLSAVVSVCKWYSSHLAVPNDRIILLTSRESNRDLAIAQGVTALTVWQYADSVRTEFPFAGEKLASPSAIETTQDSQYVYPPHLLSTEIAEGIREGRIRQGIIRMAMGTSLRATVGEVEIIGKQDLNRAIDGDMVAIEIIPTNEAALITDDHDEDEEPEEPQTAADEMAERILASPTTSTVVQGRVVGIIRRNSKEYAGTLRPDDAVRQDHMFIPADPRVPYIRIRTRNAAELLGKRIVCVVDSWDRSSKSPSGHWVAILGRAGDRDTESSVILREHQVITREFSASVLACLPPSDFRPSEAEIATRLDLRSIPVCSIDPPGCKDIDDALSCEVLPNGNFRVGVHIADVTHFVHPGTPIDLEAAERCTTVYLVEKRTDMLPGLLTADLCSLREKVDRLCFSVIWEMTADGVIVNTSFHKAIINSRASLTYAAAQARIEDAKDKSDLTESIRRLNLLAKKIRQARMDRGALELASQEVRFELDSETQDPTQVSMYVTKDTNKLVEEFMVLANQSVARQILDNFPSTSVLRRHPPPKESALESLKEVLGKQGFHDFKYGTNKELAESLSKINRMNDASFNRLVRVLTTRCMNQAEYICTGDVEPGSFWHYGLAMDLYTHFTSPIRRYADVLVHRLLAASLGLCKLPDLLQTKSQIHDQCDTMNFKHKMAQLAGRASAELHIYLFFKKIGAQDCDCIVTKLRLSKKGEIALHVQSPRYGVEGVVQLPKGWTLDARTEIATCIDSGEVIGVFDHVMVKIEADDTNYRFRTLFSFVGKSGKDDFATPTADEQKRLEAEMFPDRIANGNSKH
jgi:exosome complex exonuclease DIS3/RRP44